MSEKNTHVHSISAGGLFTGVTLGQSPVESVGKSVLLHVSENSVVNFESGEVS
jgi:hypothetical protein